MAHKIGLEVHLQLNTKTKLFCGCPQGGTEPNTNVCQVCMGMPGSKPRTNSGAVKFALQLALALNCEIPKNSIFARKTYFYPDLPKNFQITQFERPIAINGKMNVLGRDISIMRIQLEEDPASMKHAHEHSLIDYNRAGTPLCEVVTPPVFKSPAEARAFLEAMMRLADYIGVFDYQDGKIRADVNVSVDGHPRVEVKNVTSFRDVERAAQYEIVRQETVVQQGGKIVAETRSFESKNGTTESMRLKETEEEYGYIPEPDLVPIDVSDDNVNEIKRSMPETPAKRQERLVKDYGITPEQAEALISERAIVDQYEDVVKKADPGLAAMWYAYVQKILNYNSMRFGSTSFTAEHMIEFLGLVSSGDVSKRGAELLLRELIVKPGSPKAKAEHMNLLMLSKEGTAELVKKIILEQPKAVEEYKAGKEKALQFLVGQVIRASKGRADEKIVLELLKALQ